MELKQRDSQTKVKHAILAEYLADWAGIITSGSARVAQQLATKGIPFRSRFLYVDGFSHTGRYLGDRSELLRGRASDTPTWGSPIIGIQAFDRAREYARNERGLNLETAVILTENDPECFAELRTSLDLAGLTNRVAFNPTQIAPSDGQIVAIESDFLTHIHEIIQVAQALE